MIQAVFFDMDGVLIDSEQFWQEEERDVFTKLGVPVNDSMQMQTYGWGTDQVIQYFYEMTPWQGKSFSEIKNEIYSRITERVIKEGKAKRGVQEIIEFFLKKEIPLGLVSTSPMQIIDAVIEKLGLASVFKIIHSCEFEEHNKPHPGVYLTAAKKLGFDPTKCLVFEDSFVGLIAAMAARMNVVSVPDPSHADDPRYDIADLKINALNEFTDEHFTVLNQTIS